MCWESKATKALCKRQFLQLSSRMQRTRKLVATLLALHRSRSAYDPFGNCQVTSPVLISCRPGSPNCLPYRIISIRSELTAGLEVK